MKSTQLFLQIFHGKLLSNHLKKPIYVSKNQIAQVSSHAAQLQAEIHKDLKMQAWQVHSYQEDLQLSVARKPLLRLVDSVLVKVESVSINPIDVYMKDGYARTVLNLMREGEMELPLTLGRDFSGTIVQKGLTVDKKYRVGDKVYGFIPLHRQGSFAEYVIAEDGHFQHQPDHLSPTESASVVYASMTAWSALFITGGLAHSNLKDNKVLVLGASGGVGSVAVQLMKSQGIHTTGTCATDALPLVRSLGADDVFDYTKEDYIADISKSRYEIILDCANFGIDNVPKEWKFKQFITLNSPLVLNTDQYGLVSGLVRSGSSILNQNISNLKNGAAVKWGFFLPCSRGLQFINRLVKFGHIKPVIHKEYPFVELPNALNEVKKGHLRGKVVVNLD